MMAARPITRSIVMKAIPCLILALLAAPALAADTTPTPTTTTSVDKLGAVRSMMAAKRWPDAIAALKRIDETGNADWHNLFGHSLRMQTPPDLAGAEGHYDAALRISPEHRGALEYSGELFLMKSDLPRAEQRLAQLAHACASACEEYVDLKQAIDRYKAAGNKFVASP
jgi:hypothetical protein